MYTGRVHEPSKTLWSLASRWPMPAACVVTDAEYGRCFCSSFCRRSDFFPGFNLVFSQCSTSITHNRQADSEIVIPRGIHTRKYEIRIS